MSLIKAECRARVPKNMCLQISDFSWELLSCRVVSNLSSFACPHEKKRRPQGRRFMFQACRAGLALAEDTLEDRVYMLEVITLVKTGFNLFV